MGISYVSSGFRVENTTDACLVIDYGSFLKSSTVFLVKYVVKLQKHVWSSRCGHMIYPVFTNIIVRFGITKCLNQWIDMIFNVILETRNRGSVLRAPPDRTYPPYVFMCCHCKLNITFSKLTLSLWDICGTWPVYECFHNDRNTILFDGCL